jgi:hypothetical protein
MTLPAVAQLCLGTLLLLSPLAPAQEPASPPAAEPATPQVETLVCLRHGEKPRVEIGQLDVQGLNRSLALPSVLLAKYGKPAFIFAPDPAKVITPRQGAPSCYIRPLATIEPTAILCDLPVNTLFGLGNIADLEAELRKPAYQNATVFICWEHGWLQKFAHQIVTDLGGDGNQVPLWDKTMGYDAIYLIKITTQDSKSTVSFSVDHEGLDNLSKDFPSPAPLPAHP